MPAKWCARAPLVAPYKTRRFNKCVAVHCSVGSLAIGLNLRVDAEPPKIRRDTNRNVTLQPTATSPSSHEIRRRTDSAGWLIASSGDFRIFTRGEVVVILLSPGRSSG